MSSLSKPVLIGLETGVDDFVGLQSGNEHVEDPEENKDGGSDGLDRFGTAQLAAHWRITSEHQNDDSQQSLNTEDRHGESQAAHRDIKGIALRFVVDGSHGPCDTNTQEHVHSVWASHITNRGISGLVLNGSDFTGKGVRNRGSEGDESNSVDGILQVDEAAQVTGDITDNSGTGTNEDQRNNEAGVSIANS